MKIFTCSMRDYFRFPPGKWFSVDLLPLPHLRDGFAGCVDFIFEGHARVVEARQLFRSGFEEEHAAIADGSAGAEFAHACSRPGSALAIRGHLKSLAIAVQGSIRSDHGSVGAHSADGHAAKRTAVFKRYF